MERCASTTRLRIFMIFILLPWHIPKKAHFKMSIFQKQYFPHLGLYSKKGTFQKEHIPKTEHSTFRAILQKGHISKLAYSKNSTFHIQDHIIKRGASTTSLRIFMIFILLAWHIPKRAHFKMSIFQKQHFPHLGLYSKKGTFQQEHIPKTVHFTFRAIFQKGHLSQ